MVVRNSLSKLGVPAYGLYGEPLHSSPLSLHIEPIELRTRAFNGEIDVHLHHNLHQMVWLANGQMTVRIDGHPRRFAGPAAVVVPALVVHAFVAERDACGFVLTANREFFRCPESKVAGEVLARLCAAPAIFSLARHADTASDIDAMFGVLDHESAKRQVSSDLIVERLAKAIFLLVARLDAERLGSASAVPADRDLARFLALVDRHFAADLSLSEYAQRMDFSVERLIRLARKRTDKSPMQLVHERRLKEAFYRLAQTTESISEISTGLGFNDVAYFCRFFKKRAGSTPSQFRVTSGSGERARSR